MKYIKSFENSKKYNFKYKVGDFVKCQIVGEDDDEPFFGKIIESEIDEQYDGDTIFFTILTETGKIKSVWQTENQGEIIDYWNMDDEHFEDHMAAKKYNL